MPRLWRQCRDERGIALVIALSIMILLLVGGVFLLRMSATEGDIVKTCRDRLAGYKSPKQVLFVDEIPKNVSGKILKRELRDQFQGT